MLVYEFSPDPESSGCEESSTLVLASSLKSALYAIYNLKDNEKEYIVKWTRELFEGNMTPEQYAEYVIVAAQKEGVIYCGGVVYIDTLIPMDELSKVVNSVYDSVKP
jgi:hypothetical protein